MLGFYRLGPQGWIDLGIGIKVKVLCSGYCGGGRDGPQCSGLWQVNYSMIHHVWVGGGGEKGNHKEVMV